jgi:adenylate cyclase
MLRENGQELAPKQRQTILRQLSTMNADNTGTLLGGGHIYRQVSLIDILRIAEGKKLNRNDMNRLYNIPFYPKSKLFSFKNKIVVIGNTVTDIHRTPMSNTTYGPEVVASALDMFLHDHIFVQRVSSWIQWALILIMSAAIGVAVITFENMTVGFSIGFVLVLLYWMVNMIVFYQGGYVLDLALPSLVLALALVGATLYRYYIHDREKHHLTNVFAKYVSPQIMSEIVKNPERAMDNLKGGKKELTVLFSDLRDFTHQFENADPELMVNQLNEYFDVMTEIILSYGGTYDKYMGDSIMAFFGAPADVPAHAEMACRAALDMQNALDAMNAKWEQEGSKILAHGIGISSGEMFVGNFGSKNIKNFTVMGSNVNLGARLEAYTRVVHWPIIISVRTLELAQEVIQVRDLGRIQVKGFTDAVQIYGLESVTPAENLQVAQV